MKTKVLLQHYGKNVPREFVRTLYSNEEKERIRSEWFDKNQLQYYEVLSTKEHRLLFSVFRKNDLERFEKEFQEEAINKLKVLFEEYGYTKVPDNILIYISKSKKSVMFLKNPDKDKAVNLMIVALRNSSVEYQKFLTGNRSEKRLNVKQIADRLKMKEQTQSDNGIFDPGFKGIMSTWK